MARIDWRRWIEEGGDALDRDMREALGTRVEERESPFEQAHPNERMTYARFRHWSRTRGERMLKIMYVAVSVLVCLGLSAVLIYTALDMPHFGEDAALIDNDISTFYVEEGVYHTGAMNIVTSIILDFRGFDTLGESHVLFVAACMVIMLLRLPAGDSPEDRLLRERAEAHDRHFEPRGDKILANCVRVIVPLIIVFGAYILLNGHLSPGGGFSGGTVLGAGLVLYLCNYGFKRTARIFNFKIYRAVTALALAFYALSKGYVFFTGANHIENGLGPGAFGRILSGGLLMPLSVAVGLVVASTMYALYALFRKGDL